MKKTIIVDVAIKKEKGGSIWLCNLYIFVQQIFIKKWFGVTKIYKNLYGLIKYNKTNSITPMEIHVERAPPKLS
jgi:hypothetical protein